MTQDQELYKTLSEKARKLRLPFPKVPKYVIDNLKYDLFYWQREAFENLITYENIKEIKNPNPPTHLMFNMATGTGKTLLMAACILYYYEKGYRHFLFFVNQNNIVDKTENNFVESQHRKYLFTKNIIVNDRTIDIKKVNTFSKHTNDIEVKFTTIQKLYNDIHVEKENNILLDELDNKNIVMLADEAHHLNTNTQQNIGQTELDLETEITGKTGEAEVERKGWEHTVINLLLNKRGNYDINNNILLEFTATLPEDKQVAEKYMDKIIYKFGLKEFLGEGYTKEINLISSHFDKKDRILHALLFNWYREKIALKHYGLGNKSLANFKPVVLFRSKSIDESKQDYEYFQRILKELTVSDFSFLDDIENKIIENKNAHEKGKSRTRDVLEYIKRENISYSHIVNYIKHNFSERNCIITNSDRNTTKKEKTDDEQERLLNSLEDKENNIRAIFTVKRLTEGWDVLNLFDIVRLYQGQNAGGSSRKTPKATIEEKQLIGRGVRYYPFSYKNHVENKRKFDDEMDNELRVLEELYYYTYDEDSRYISHLKEELRKDGYIKDNKVEKRFNLKPEFKEKPFYNNTVLWINEKINNPNRKKKSLDDLKENWFFECKVAGFEYTEEELHLQKDKDVSRIEYQEKTNKTLNKNLSDFDRQIFYKAINIKAQPENSIFKFKNLKTELDIDSIDDLLKEEFMGGLDVNIVVNQDLDFKQISNKEKLKILSKVLDKFMVEIKEYINPYIGTEFKPVKFYDVFGKPKTKVIEENEESVRIAQELFNEDWYILNDFNGTDEEIGLINEIKNTISNLKMNYQEVYLLRNEEVYKLFDFDTGRGFQPDFILLLKSKDKKNQFYHVFIEPKGNGLLDKDKWKNDLLKEITEKYSTEGTLTFETDNYSLIGLPLYNINNKQDFRNEYEKLWRY
ncbi:DEAD/DEAH box helicase family protein [Lentibacillus sp. CBA3610]|uniref:DEAD/DEAH box helicase family protein n=1 Tax=Lentibacillus sp. CBA3610 TaxID=2518176 RepID=UPI001595F4D7|nr:DEAD/DEAH box helicase family protein [Lentibacillus sp. CBA3610]QKY71363.1 type III restriction endonuclease [Lentibacillus sp. CBA3610]